MHLEVGNVIKFHQDWNGVQFAKNASCIRKFCALFHMGVSLHSTLCTSCWKDLDMSLKYWNGGSCHTSGSAPSGGGAPSPSNIQFPNKMVLCTHYIPTHRQTTLTSSPCSWFLKHRLHSDRVHPQTKRGRIMVKNNCCFMSFFLLTKDKINNFSLTMGKHNELAEAKTTFLSFPLFH